MVNKRRMVNKKKNTSTSVNVRQRRGRPTKNQRGHLGFAHSKADLDHTVALSDPFSDQARGAKIPDEDSTKSFAVQIRDIAGIDSDANGRAAMVIRPGTASSVDTGNVITATEVTSWNGSVSLSDNTALAAAGNQYRIVSWGVRIYSQLAPTNQSGQFRVITMPEDHVSPFNYNTSFFEEIKVYPTTEDSVHWISKPIGVTWKEYVDVGNHCPWERVVIVAEGLPAIQPNCFTVEIVMNLEIQPQLGSITGAIANDAAEHKPHVMTAAGEVLKRHGGAMVRSGASKFFENAAKAALNFVSTRLIGMPLITQPRRPLLVD